MAHRGGDSILPGTPKGIESEQTRPNRTTLEQLFMRTSVTLLCMAALATSPLFSGKASGSSEERRIEERLARARNKIDDVMLKDADSKELIKRSRVYIARAETALANHHYAFAGSLSEAADALSRAVDHVVRSKDITRTDYPTQKRLSDRLNSVGLRVQQANYFQKLGGDSTAKALVGLARRYNDRARDSFRHGKRRETDEYTTVADEIVSALEYIAYAQTAGGGRRG